MNSDSSSASGPEHYAPLAKWLHWIIALCVLTIIPVGIIMGEMNPGALQDQLYNLHRSLGVLVMALALLRIAVRFGYGAPAPYAGLTGFERTASGVVHFLLYFLLFTMPIVGWLMMSAYGGAYTFFGLFEVPPAIAKNEYLYKILQKVHKGGGIAMGLCIVLHVAGALMHTFVKRDVVLWRMLPRNWS